MPSMPAIQLARQAIHDRRLMANRNQIAST